MQKTDLWWPKDLELSLLWRGFNSWPENFLMSRVQPGKKTRCQFSLKFINSLHCGPSPHHGVSAAGPEPLAGGRVSVPRADLPSLSTLEHWATVKARLPFLPLLLPLPHGLVTPPGPQLAPNPCCL